ncbi:hypothetical protein J7432_20945 [Xanthomonas axonopodis pv. begoniae]|nr:hypothetical protein [Xanthomonas axonopodis pv. begoniae]
MAHDPLNPLAAYSALSSYHRMQEMQNRAIEAMRPSYLNAMLSEEINYRSLMKHFEALSHIEITRPSILEGIHESKTIQNLLEQSRIFSNEMAVRQQLAVYENFVEQAKGWIEPLNNERSSIGRILRQFESEAAQTRLAGDSLVKHFHAVSRMAQNEEFLRWADLTSAHLNPDAASWSNFVREDSPAYGDDGGERTRKRLAIPPILREFWSTPEHRIELLLLILSLLMYWESNLSSNRNQIELTNAINEQTHFKKANALAKDEKIADLTQLVESLQAFQAMSNRFTVISQKSALRTSPNGHQFNQLEYGDEVLVLRNASKWRLISTYDKGGHEIQGWVLGKHLRRIEE